MVFLFIVIFSSLTLSIKSIFFFQRKLAEEQGKKQEERENERNRMHSSDALKSELAKKAKSDD